jgi:hypothetical protein
MGALVPGEGIKWELGNFAKMRVLIFSFQFLIVFLERIHTYSQVGFCCPPQSIDPSSV